MITLKSIKTVPSMSEETIAFTATVYFNGKRVGAAWNGGRGDPIAFDIPQETTKEMEAWVAVNVPLGKPDKNFPEGFQLDLECYVFGIVEQHDRDQQMKRWVRTKVLFRIEGDDEGAYRTFRVKDPKHRPLLRKKIEDKYGDKVLEIHGA